MLTHPARRAIAALGMLVIAATTSASPVRADDQEDAIGRQVYGDLQKKGEIIAQSPYYETLAPIVARIKVVADPQYDRPFRFILVHEPQPNAFAVPGGNVYVTDSLMTFVKTKEELAGVLCHETSHTIHHDVVHNLAKSQRLQIGATLAEILLGGGQNPYANTVIGLAASAEQGRFTRPVETAADLKGSETCAQAGYNPYGMIWLFDRFQAAGNGGGAEFLSDHPRDDHRISDLKTHFAQDPALFGKFDPDPKSGTPLGAPSSLATPAAIGPSREYAPEATPSPVR
jgi:predicted Zn-dependent protease